VKKLRQEKITEFRERFANPFIAAERGYIDAVIEPAETRVRIITALRALENKRDTNPRKKHGKHPALGLSLVWRALAVRGVRFGRYRLFLREFQ